MMTSMRKSTRGTTTTTTTISLIENKMGIVSIFTINIYKGR
jgi:hypothetical protein